MQLRHPKLAILLPAANLLIATVLLFFCNRTYPPKKYDMPPTPFATNLCLGMNAPANAVQMLLKLGLKGAEISEPPYWPTLLVCIALQWTLIGFLWQRRGILLGRSYNRGLSVIACVGLSVFLLLIALWPLEVSTIVIRQNASALIRTPELLGELIYGMFNLLWAGFFLTLAILIPRPFKREKLFAFVAFGVGFLGALAFYFLPDTSRLYGSPVLCPICPLAVNSFPFKSQLLGEAVEYGFACGCLYGLIAAGVGVLRRLRWISSTR
jgi:hypothetical protein